MPPAVTVRGGKIASITAAIPKFNALPVLDFKHAVISPGVVDVHAHLNEPGREDWEGERSAPAALLLPCGTACHSFPACLATATRATGSAWPWGTA